MEKFPPGISYGCLSVCEEKMLLFGVWACFFSCPPFFSLGAVAPSLLLGRLSGVWSLPCLFVLVVVLVVLLVSLPSALRRPCAARSPLLAGGPALGWLVEGFLPWVACGPWLSALLVLSLPAFPVLESVVVSPLGRFVARVVWCGVDSDVPPVLGPVFSSLSGALAWAPSSSWAGGSSFVVEVRDSDWVLVGLDGEPV